MKKAAFFVAIFLFFNLKTHGQEPSDTTEARFYLEDLRFLDSVLNNSGLSDHDIHPFRADSLMDRLRLKIEGQGKEKVSATVIFETPEGKLELRYFTDSFFTDPYKLKKVWNIGAVLNDSVQCDVPLFALSPIELDGVRYYHGRAEFEEDEEENRYGCVIEEGIVDAPTLYFGQKPTAISLKIKNLVVDFEVRLLQERRPFALLYSGDIEDMRDFLPIKFQRIWVPMLDVFDPTDDISALGLYLDTISISDPPQDTELWIDRN